MDDKHVLKTSAAGMRLIALMTIYNQWGDERLLRYIAESCHTDLLLAHAAETRAAQFNALREAMGKLQVQQVIGASKENVIVLLRAEFGGEVLIDMRVEEDYPHAITDISVTPLTLSASGV